MFGHIVIKVCWIQMLLLWFSASEFESEIFLDKLCGSVATKKNVSQLLPGTGNNTL